MLHPIYTFHIHMNTGRKHKIHRLNDDTIAEFERLSWRVSGGKTRSMVDNTCEENSC